MQTVLTVSMIIGNGGYLAAVIGGARTDRRERARVATYRAGPQFLSDLASLDKGWLMLGAMFCAESSLWVNFRSLFSSCARSHPATASSDCLKV